MTEIYNWPPQVIAAYIAYGQTADGPWWMSRGDVLAAQMCQAVLNSQGGKASLSDCLLDWTPQPQPLMDWDAVIAHVSNR